MTKILIFIGTTLLFFSSPIIAQKRINKSLLINSSAKEIKRLENVIQSAIMKRDTALVAKMLDANFIAIEPDRTDTKSEQLADIFQSVTNWIQNGVVTDSFRLSDMIIHQYGNTAISTFVKEVFGKELGHFFDRKVRYQNVWVNTNNAWLQVSSETVRMPSDIIHDREKIKNLITEREYAKFSGDVSVGQRVLASSYTHIDEIGTVTYKSDRFKNIADSLTIKNLKEINNELHFKLNVDSFHYNFYNNNASAVVTYRLFYHLVFHNEACEKVFQCNEVLVKKNGFNWQSVSHSETVIPGNPVATIIDPGVYDAYVGRYQLFSSKYYDITKEDGKLWFNATKKVELVPEDQNSFVENGLNFYRVRFIKNEKGTVTHIRIIEFPGVEYSAMKVQ